MQAVERQKDVPFSFPIQQFAIWEKDTLNNGDIKEAHIALIEYKGNMFKKIFNRIRQFFRVWGVYREKCLLCFRKILRAIFHKIVVFLKILEYNVLSFSKEIFEKGGAI